MPRVHKSQIEVRAPARRVFDVLSDPQTLIAGMPMVKRVEHTPDGPMRRGTRLLIIGDGGEGEEIPMEAEVTDFIPPRLIETSGYMSRKRGVNRAVSRYELEQYGAVTRLTVTSRIDLDSWGQWLFWPITRLLLDWTSNRMLARIKETAEGAS